MALKTTTFERTLDCLHLPGWQLRLKVTATLVMLLFFAPDVISQVPVIDGNPSEWPGILNNASNTKKGFRHDPFQQNGVDDQWTAVLQTMMLHLHQTGTG